MFEVDRRNAKLLRKAIEDVLLGHVPEGHQVLTKSPTAGPLLFEGLRQLMLVDQLRLDEKFTDF